MRVLVLVSLGLTLGACANRPIDSAAQRQYAAEAGACAQRGGVLVTTAGSRGQACGATNAPDFGVPVRAEQTY